MKRWIWILCLLCASCQRYGLLVHRQRVDASYLASTHVGSPDPRQKCPPHGQLLVAEWWVPAWLLERAPRLKLHILFRNYSEEVVEFPICRRLGYESYPVLDAKFDETGGLLTYRAEIVTGDGQVFREWKHQMWVNLISLEE
jgi:hypothetical protein